MLQPVAPILVVDLFPGLHAELLVLLRSLAPADWEKPTAAAGWTVRDMVSHMLDTDMRYLSLQRDHLPPLQPDQPIASYDDLVAFVNQLNNDWVTVARRISPALLIDLHAVVGPQVHAFLKTLDPYAPSHGPVSWAGPEVAPTWFDLAREYTEKWHHQMHIRDAVRAPGLTGRRWLHPTLETFVRALPRTYRHVAAPEGTQVVLDVTGEAGDTWTLVREAGVWRLYQERDDQVAAAAAARVQMDQDTAWRLFTKGLDPAMAHTRAQINGDAALGSQLLNAVAIIA